MKFDLTVDEMAFGEAEDDVEGMVASYNTVKRAAVGSKVMCPVCDRIFLKKRGDHAFCSFRGRGNCKDRYWNLTVDARRLRAISIVRG